MLTQIISALNGNSCLLTIELLQSLVRFAAQFSLMPENISKLSFYMSGLFLLIVESLLFFVEWNVGVLLYIRKTDISVLEKRNLSSTFSMISRTVFLRALIRKTIKHTKRETYSETPQATSPSSCQAHLGRDHPLILFIFDVLPC